MQSCLNFSLPFFDTFGHFRHIVRNSVPFCSIWACCQLGHFGQFSTVRANFGPAYLLTSFLRPSMVPHPVRHFLVSDLAERVYGGQRKPAQRTKTSTFTRTHHPPGWTASYSAAFLWFPPSPANRTSEYDDYDDRGQRGDSDMGSVKTRGWVCLGQAPCGRKSLVSTLKNRQKHQKLKIPNSRDRR